MKKFDAFTLDYAGCRKELGEFKALLDAHATGTLEESKHVLPFFKTHRNLAGLVGHLATRIAQVDRIAYEFDFFGDYAADLALGDSTKREYCFVEFEDGKKDSIFKKAGAKVTLEWSPRFDHGYSQIIDWFWKLHNMRMTADAEDRFGHSRRFKYEGILVIGRSGFLSDMDMERLEWRREKVIADTCRINCMTFDELYDDLAFKLKEFSIAESLNATPAPAPRPRPARRWKRPRRGK